jgi:PKD repeat protein
MNRIVVCSAVLAASLSLALTGCGGGGTETPQPATTTTVAASKAPNGTAPVVDPDAETAPLLAWADGTPEEGPAPLTVEFKADVEGGTPPLKYQWQFGDGSPESTEPNPKHTYAKAGKYRADLNVSDGADDSDSDYIEIEVR